MLELIKINLVDIEYLIKTISLQVLIKCKVSLQPSFTLY
jgi:hypothetical protein